MDFGIVLFFFFLLAGCASILDAFLDEAKVDEARRGILGWWADLQREDPTRLAQRGSREFVRLFHRMYGARHGSWRTFRRSLLFSAFGFFVVALICEGIRLGYPSMIVDELPNGIFMLFIGNSIADYLSLWETRWVLRRRGRSPAGWLPAWLVLD
uniref:Uncharacterized protein n=1 Tax=Candidatus Kentrum eta TaxID=2126337 RepID=A0A450V7I8_9GAMM|nr:MAG: hypothetical protein BECKH772B_GA0070898_102025 [Candidatus Kentron sp. H]VFK00785.1 MAG: hypothetical protein BECKH772A_GA0070896_102025 [Candidatus Kentron sp. H]VFK04698.1 MAG: hypothetical protein BECKH772C_GA0070978_102005 [Candidatus Kentron sp. H]